MYGDFAFEFGILGSESLEHAVSSCLNLYKCIHFVKIKIFDLISCKPTVDVGYAESFLY